MTSRGAIPFSAQWALKGKQPDGEDYRVLACSNGDLTRANFADALSRFQLGELSTLPQVSVSYARHGTDPSVSYVALAIHWYVAEGQRYANGVSQQDNQGRPTTYTNYFCLPYHRLANAAIGYLDMYEALSAVTLTAADGPPIDVPIAVPATRTPSADDLAVRVAPLLLTGQPVCVVGAESTTMLERLQFINTVMDLLPYGFRARMAAATLTRATNRNHRFRLFFSSTPRADETGYVVAWGGDPGLIPVPSREAGEYFDWLQDNLGPLSHLTELTSERGFGHRDTLQALESVLGARHRFHARPRWGAPAPNGGHRPPPVPVPVPVEQVDLGEQALMVCAEHVKQENPTRLRSAINDLKKLAEGEIGESARARYQSMIIGFRLLRHDSRIEDRHREKLYDALLRVAFGVPLSYRGYCSVEDCAGLMHGAAPHPQLLTAILKSGLSDPLVSAIVYGHLGVVDEKKLNKWLTSGQVDATVLIDLLATASSYPQHARIVCDVTLAYLAKAQRCYQPQRVRAALQEHGFLARALQKYQPDQDQYQFDVLYQLIRAVYPQPAVTPGQELSWDAIQQILSGLAGPPPTPALLCAVLMLLYRPESREHAWTAYVRGSLVRANFDERTHAFAFAHLPPLGPAQNGGPGLPPIASAQPDQDVTQQIPRSLTGD
jgi:ribosomal protein L34